MKRWMFPLLLVLATLSRAEHQIDFDPNLFTGSATPVAVYANIGFAAPGVDYLAQDLSGPSGVPAMWHAVWMYDAQIPSATPIRSFTIDYGCSTQVKTLPNFAFWYIPGPTNPPTSPESFNTMHCDIANQPPTAFDLLSPANGSTAAEAVVDLDWQDATDPDDDPLTYRLYLSQSPDDLTSTDPLYTGTDSDVEFTGQAGLTYYWTVGVEDGQDHTTYASSTWSFTINDPGSPPVLDPIGDRSMFEDEDLPLYIWASDNDEDTVTFEASSDNPSVSVLIEGPVEINDAYLTLTPLANFYGTANITVTVDDGNGNTDSETFLLTVENTNDAPNAFDLLTPTDEAVVSSRTLTLAWEAGSDPDPAGPFSYTVYLASTLDNLTNFENVVASWITETSVEVTVDGMGPWFWTVVTYDNNEASTEATAAYSFTSDLAPVLDPIDDVVMNEDTQHVINLVIADPESDITSLSVTSVEASLVVSLEEVPSRTLFYDLILAPAANWTGESEVTLTVNDGAGHSDSETFLVTVSSLNDAPAAFSLLLPADGATLVPFPGNLSWETAVDPDTEDTVTYTVYMSDDPQTVMQNPVESGLLDPSLTVGGTPGDSFWWTVKADDGNSPSVWADETFSFTYDFVNAPPVFTTIGDRSMNEDTSINFVISANDPEGGAVTFSAVSDTSGVVVTWLPQRDSRWIILTPIANWNGVATITVTASDGEGMSTDESFLLTVNALNDRPTVSEFNLYTLEDTPVEIPWEGFDVDGDSLIVESFMSPITVGEVIGDTYYPPADFNGFDAFLYRVFDGILYSEWTAVQVNIEPVNDNPMLDLPGIMNTDEDVALNLDFRDYQSDIDLDSLVITVATPTDLLVTISGYDVTIQGPANWSGSETLTFTVDDRALRLTATDQLTVNVLAVNDAPVVPTLALGTLEDTALPHALGGTDVENSPLTFTVSTQPQHGTYLNGVYTPAADFFGADSLAYHANDGELDSETGWLLFTVSPVNDAPVATAQSLQTAEETPLPITFSGTDVENDPLTFSVVSGPFHGSFISGIYTPVLDFFGADSIGFTANDGELTSPMAWVSIMVQNLDDCPVLVTPFADVTLAEPDSDTEYTITAAQIVSHYTDPDGDTITSSDVTVDIPADFNGVLPVNFSVTSGDCTVDGGFDLVVEARNDAPAYSLCEVDCGEIVDLEAFAAVWPTAGIALNDIDGDSLSVVWFVNGEEVCTQFSGPSMECATFCLDLTPYMDDPQDITVHFEIHDDSTIVNLDGDLCSWFLGFLDVAGGALPDKFYLADNYPNPFNPSTTVRFGLTREQQVRAEVFNLRGQRVALLLDGALPAGHHDVVWNAGQASSGMYVLVLSSEEGVRRQKMMLVR